MASNKGLQSPCESHDSLSTQLTNKSRLWTWKKGWWQSNRHNALQLRPKTALVDYEPELLSHLSLCHDLRTQWVNQAPSYRMQWEHFSQNCGTDNFSWFPTLDFAWSHFSHFTSHNGLQNPGHVFILTIDGSSWSKVLRNVYSLDESHYLFGGVNISLSWYTSHLCCGSTPPGDFCLENLPDIDSQALKAMKSKPTGLWPKKPSKWRIATELSQQSNGCQSYQILDTFSRGYQIKCPTWCRTFPRQQWIRRSQQLRWSKARTHHSNSIPSHLKALKTYNESTTNQLNLLDLLIKCDVCWILVVSLQLNLGLISWMCVFPTGKNCKKHIFQSPPLHAQISPMHLRSAPDNPKMG